MQKSEGISDTVLSPFEPIHDNSVHIRSQPHTAIASNGSLGMFHVWDVHVRDAVHVRFALHW